MTALPLIATVPLLPPFGLLMLLAWRLLDRFALRPLGGGAARLRRRPGQRPAARVGGAVVALCFLLIDLIEQRLVFRDFWQDWLIAAGLIGFCLLGRAADRGAAGARMSTPRCCCRDRRRCCCSPSPPGSSRWIDVKRGACREAPAPLVTAASQAYSFSRRAWLLGAAQAGVRRLLLAARMGWLAIAENERYNLAVREQSRQHRRWCRRGAAGSSTATARAIANNRTDFRVDLIPERLDDPERELALLHAAARR